uniref:Secreted protein n=1 Tax=Magallana gigas TaxID=29159 RepID=A0A8W8MKB3_MAGGI
MGVAALALVVLLVLGCALRALLKHFHVQCRTPVRRRPRTMQELCRMEEGSRISPKPTSGGGGLKPKSPQTLRVFTQTLLAPVMSSSSAMCLFQTSREHGYATKRYE